MTPLPALANFPLMKTLGALASVFLILGFSERAWAQAQDDLDREAAEVEAGESSGEAAREEMLKNFRESARRQAEELDALPGKMQAQYDELLRNMAAQREALKAKVSRQWTEFHESTNKNWVVYNEKADSVSQVDFEKGTVEIETLIPVEDVTKGRKKTAILSDLLPKEREKVKEIAEMKIREQTEKIVAEKEKGEPILKGQFQVPKTPPKMIIESKPVVAEDGKPRLKVKVVLPMTPEHVKIRAKQNQARVEASAKKYGLDPAFVFAVIHTESFFNPRARSHAPAFGLMQLMAQSGAREAHQYLYREDKLLSPEELYDPDTNVLLGATYLHMLMTRHFGKIKNPENRRTLAIAAYNCGPGCVRRDVLSKKKVDEMTNDELVSYIRRSVPKETQEYVPKVQGRIPLYQKL